MGQVPDEAAQTTEISASVPIANVHARRLVLVGDHCQLPATALSLEAETRGLTLSLFQRLVSRGFPSFFLDTQFRMHPCIAEHSSMEFYGGKLRTGVKPQSRRGAPKGKKLVTRCRDVHTHIYMSTCVLLVQATPTDSEEDLQLRSVE